MRNQQLEQTLHQLKESQMPLNFLNEVNGFNNTANSSQFMFKDNISNVYTTARINEKP